MSKENLSVSPSKLNNSSFNISQNEISKSFNEYDFSSFMDYEYSDTESTSSDGMEIVITESPNRKKVINLEDKKVLENIEEEIEKQLDEKATKSNLTATNVKNILKHVISNEHVLAMVRHTVEEGDSTDEETFVYEPKLTRAKAKELFEKKNVINPWVKPLPKPTSDVNILIEQELPEDSDDDEYVPNENEESEDDRDRSDLDSEPMTPQTPQTPFNEISEQIESTTQTNWTEDGIFRIPDTPTSRSKKDFLEENNIALRTRSKFSLSDTPLEKIEESFIPPDITTDMYDSECDDEDWKDFLKKFTKPLEETETGQLEDDDEADPEYNVLADEEICTVDHEELHEELREDKAVKITKKELSNLVAELFDYSDLFLMDDIPTESNLNQNTIKTENLNDSQINNENKNYQDHLAEPEVLMTYEQKQLLDQQLRQHVQLTTQHYLQVYRHPEYGHMATNLKNFIITLNEMGKYKTVSAFHIANLPAATELIQNWEQKFENGDEEILKMEEFVWNELKKTREYFETRSRKLYEQYIPHFSPYFMKTVAESCVFMYPHLLPRIPFKCDVESPKQYYYPSENELIALGLEQFENYVENYDRNHIGKFGKVRWRDAAFFIAKYIMPIKDVEKLYQHLKCSNQKNANPNPIQYFFLNKKAPVTTQYVTTLETQGVLPPNQRTFEELPKPWKNYIYPPHKRRPKKEKPKRSPKKKKSKINKENFSNTLSVNSIPQNFGQHFLVQDPKNPDIFNLVPIYENHQLPKIAIPNLVKTNPKTPPKKSTKRKRENLTPEKKNQKKLNQTFDLQNPNEGNQGVLEDPSKQSIENSEVSQEDLKDPRLSQKVLEDLPLSHEDPQVSQEDLNESELESRTPKNDLQPSQKTKVLDLKRSQKDSQLSQVDVKNPQVFHEPQVSQKDLKEPRKQKRSTKILPFFPVDIKNEVFDPEIDSENFGTIKRSQKGSELSQVDLKNPQVSHEDSQVSQKESETLGDPNTPTKDLQPSQRTKVLDLKRSQKGSELSQTDLKNPQVSHDPQVSQKDLKDPCKQKRSTKILPFFPVDIKNEVFDPEIDSENFKSKTENLVLVDIVSLHKSRFRELQKIAISFKNKDFLSIFPYYQNLKFNSNIFQKYKISISKKSKNLGSTLKMSLPSMPFLLTPIKNQNIEDSKIRAVQSAKEKLENEENCEENSQEKLKKTSSESEEIEEISETATVEKKDNEDELQALMVASSTIQKNLKNPMENQNRKISNLEKRKTKIQREYNAMLAILTPENANFEEEKANNFAQAYFDKVHERLENSDNGKYQKFMEILGTFDAKNSISELYENLKIIFEKDQDLLDEFLMFLTPVQAKEIGKLVEHFLISNMSNFLKKLEIFFQNQPAQLRKIYNSLTELSKIQDLSMEMIKNTILPLLKGNSILIDWFLQMFPCEKPPDSMMTVYETIQCEDENFDDENEPFEAITLPETEDPYGGPNCICECHKSQDEIYASRNRHCIPCGTKFIQGRVYVQTGKGLRLANVTFNDSPNLDHNKRLGVKMSNVRQKRKSETSPVKNSPIKISINENIDNQNHSTESEDDLTKEGEKQKRNCHSSPKKQMKNVSKSLKQLKKLNKKTKKVFNKKIESGEMEKVEVCGETVENDFETEIFNQKSPVRSIESCEETSQDSLEKNSEDSSNSENFELNFSESENSDFESENVNLEQNSIQNSNSGSLDLWTREEDKVILQMFKEYGDGEHIYKNIQQVLCKRTVFEIRQRFRLLLSLLQEMSHI